MPRRSTGPVPALDGRDTSIDSLRGLAVFVMVGANMVPYVLDQPYPFWLRIYASLAAPAFILLVGYMVGWRHARRPAPLWRHLKRMLALWLVAALVDVLIWGTEPFSSFDVLYLIALVPPASHLVLRSPRLLTPVVAAAIFLATPALQAVLGYEAAAAGSTSARLRALFVDGWFPVFPWLGVGIMGARLGALRGRRGVSSAAHTMAVLGAALLFAGGFTWWLTTPEHRTAGGFAELFYPPTLGVLFSILGFEVAVLAFLSRRGRAWILRAFAVYGRAALAMYLAHLAIIAFVCKPWLDHQNVPTFVALYLAHALALWGLALALRRWCPTPRSFWGRLLLGS